MATAIAFRCPQAVAALAEVGASVDNPVFAAAAGRVDLLERMIESGGKARRDAGHCRVPWLGMSHDPVGAARDALIRAAQFGHDDAVELLLARGVDVHGQSRDGISAIHEAAFAGHAAVVRRLLDHGADPGVRDGQYQATAIGWARQSGHDDLAREIAARHPPDVTDAADLGMTDRVRQLVDEDPSLVSGPDGKGAPLRIAAHRGHAGLVDLLVERGADPTLPNDLGKDAIAYAREAGHAELARWLEGHARG